MQRSEYDRLIDEAASLWSAGPTDRQAREWWRELQDFTSADAEDALRRLARTHDKLPSLATWIAETKTVRNGRPRPRAVPHVWGEQERERLIRYGKLIASASEAGRLDVVRQAMAEAERTSPPGDPLAAGEAALRPSPAIA